MAEEATPTPVIPPKRSAKEHPQALISKFWQKFHHKNPGKITSIFPRDLYKTVAPNLAPPSIGVRNAAQSYEIARSKCLAMVRKAVARCESTNSKFIDQEFEIESDHYMQTHHCLRGLVRSDDFYYEPGSVHRVSWIFDNPQFTVDGFSGSDIKQGYLGNCWWVAAIGNIAHRKDLMKKICVARDEECGVYGFVFFKDGEWIPTIIDDNLYLKERDYGKDEEVYDVTGKKAKQWKRNKQTGSEALSFASCVDENETWLPLLEKAFAKVHGDYEALVGGCVGGGVEDMTGGVSSMVLTTSILRKEKLWRELLQADQDDGEFVFGLSPSYSPWVGDQNGIVLGHAYSIIRAVEVTDEKENKIKLVKIRNPWGETSRGEGEWHGPWSDGSKEWTGEMLKKLRHEFGDDGVWWMTLDDMLQNFQRIYRTRLFDARWTVAQQWTSLPIAWVAGYHKTKFVITVQEEGLAAIVLSKLDERYFSSLAGPYEFTMNFIILPSGSDEPIGEAHCSKLDSNDRSANCEIFLQPGKYDVIPRVIAANSNLPPVEDVVKEYSTADPLKLQQKGLLYDIAHAKVGVIDEDAAYAKKKQEEKAKEKAKKKKEKAEDAEKNQMRQAMEQMTSAMAAMQVELDKEKSKEEEEKKDKEKTKEGEKKSGNASKDEKKEGDSDSKATPPSGESAAPSAPENKGGKKEEKKEEEKEEKEKKEKDKEEDESSNEDEEQNKAEEKEAEAEEEEEEEDDSDDSDDDDDNEGRLPWNAVCVAGLRVYSEDKNISVEVVQSEE
ncbi:unnamed protein product [Clonostachys chloroleuca]|uniref:Calpain catalytic domain-containing protein n=1 Tax=Clonostachys chloroleuca TaxID=1926264 RepID=A0AA35LSV6_9HYPO|nr:unnamed protein product [Clonostachys chloroleuca]